VNPFETIVVTTDFSETSRLALPAALEIAKVFGSKLVLLHVVEDRLPPFVDEFTAYPVEEVLGSRVRRAAEELERFALPHEGPGADIERVVLHGTPHLEIVAFAAARSAGLIAMATHGRGFISHALFGSTTERVLRRAPCPVLTVRTPEP
jgi:nucleotide-binding universal stress UspA family protein